MKTMETHIINGIPVTIHQKDGFVMVTRTVNVSTIDENGSRIEPRTAAFMSIPGAPKTVEVLREAERVLRDIGVIPAEK